MTTATQLSTDTRSTAAGCVGAPRGNSNAFRHGMRGSNLPHGCEYIAKAIRYFRRQLEQAVFEVRGEVTLLDAASINTAFRYERLAQLAQRWLAVNSEEMSYTEKLACAREAARASAERDKAIAMLKLDERQQSSDPFTTLLIMPPVAPPEPSANATLRSSTNPAPATAGPSDTATVRHTLPSAAADDVAGEPLAVDGQDAA